MSKKVYLRNEQLTKVPVEHGEEKVTVNLYEKTYDVSTLKKFLETIYYHKHEGLPIFGDIKAVWYLYNKVDGNRYYVKYWLPIRKELKKYKINYYWKIHTKDTEGNKYVDVAKATTHNSTIPRRIPVADHKQIYNNCLNMHYTDIVDVIHPYAIHTKGYNYTMKFDHYYSRFYQPKKEVRNSFPKERSTRVKTLMFNM